MAFCESRQRRTLNPIGTRVSSCVFCFIFHRFHLNQIGGFSILGAYHFLSEGTSTAKCFDLIFGQVLFPAFSAFDRFGRGCFSGKYAKLLSTCPWWAKDTFRPLFGFCWLGPACPLGGSGNSCEVYSVGQHGGSESRWGIFNSS